MKRAFSVLSCAAVLIALLPATASAARPTKYTEHSVFVYCEEPVDGGYAIVTIGTSNINGDGASADVWLDPAVPFEDPTSMTGVGSTVERTESLTEVLLTSSFPVADPDGVELGDAVITATMAPVGDPEIIGPTPFKSNHQSKTHGTSQGLEGTASLSLPGLELSLSSCSGSLTDLTVDETNPHSFVSSAMGVQVDCSWQGSDDTFAYFFAQRDGSDFFATAGLTTPELDINGSAATGSLSAASVTVTVPLTDSATGDPYMAAAAATFSTVGSPFTSTLITQHSRGKATEQALAAYGTLAFDTGDSFVMDAEHCRAERYDRHSQNNVASGPKPGAAPINDAPDGAIRLTTASKTNFLTGGTVPEAEVPNVTCPEGQFDAMGHTVWYTVIGTGHPVTIDTSGSDFDTVVAAYAPENGGLTEIACDDDVVYVPIGTSYQAAVTFDTLPGVEYYIQVGGLQNFFSGEIETGRLRLALR